MTTKLQWITHASCMICHDDFFLISDPWYIKKAFTTWTVKPPPIINPKLIIDLTKSGKLGFILSHHHFDHYDINFIKRCDKKTPIFITDFSKNEEEDLPEVKALYNSLVDHCKMENVTEIPVGENHYSKFGPFKLMSLRREKPYTIDGIIIVQSPDCFIMHCADCWGIKETSYAGRVLKKIKPKYLPSLYMGQAGTASGWPLIYSCYSEKEKEIILKAKTKKMITGIYNTCKIFGIDKALGYAHLSYVYANNIDYFTKYNYTPITGKGANKITNSDLFLEIQPSSIVIPSDKFKIINLIPTMDMAHYFEDNMIGENLKKYKFSEEYKIKIDKWLDVFILFANKKVKEGVVNENDINLIFEMTIVGDEDGDKILYNRQIKLVEGKRMKCLKCKESVFINVMNGDIPFKDLDIGYLAELSRTPPSYYNDMFFMVLSTHSHSFFNCNIIDTEEYEFQE